MLDVLSEPVIVSIVGLIGGIFLGLAARVGRFCTLGAIEDLFYGETLIKPRLLPSSQELKVQVWG